MSIVLPVPTEPCRYIPRGTFDGARGAFLPWNGLRLESCVGVRKDTDNKLGQTHPSRISVTRRHIHRRIVLQLIMQPLQQIDHPSLMIIIPQHSIPDGRLVPTIRVIALELHRHIRKVPEHRRSFGRRC